MNEQEIIPSQQMLATFVGEEVVTRRLHGVQQLCNFLNHKIPVGQSVHILTGGNCDLLSQLLWITRVYVKARNLHADVEWYTTPASLHPEQLIEKNHQLGSPVPDEDFRRKFELFEKWLRKNK